MNDEKWSLVWWSFNGSSVTIGAKIFESSLEADQYSMEIEGAKMIVPMSMQGKMIGLLSSTLEEAAKND